ncbi:50S ribosome-binding GTPase [Tessaracoccus sp. MC1865]|uniref:sulfate adenylyltransferase subunit 1 n=1 Tax=Tessaracoccus sp. MC1865 TaxID=2760310 RepID=UPI001601CF77|nr:GTP-binding protein [Tessaracoccus sp. MC1865]MBB1483933.1 50S ribosome-binding GTPase [Tessaracoccus sp. MC1865]QTO36982.1 50S ribosome-binding GTPase [Tessaracoccus sp. MC1865]
MSTHDLLRLATAGSVDDGKSTLVGRLLYDTKSVLADQLDAVDRVSRERGLEGPDLALLTDGLRAEREQGITIDVAYRYFSTANRSYVLADTPGHVQYTRNMVTGASTAELALILVDARHGVVEQTRRHLAVTGLLGVRHVAIAVNKMDLVDWDESRFTEIVADARTVAARFDIQNVLAVPLSALRGDNVVERSANTPWYSGPTLLEHLEAVPVGTNPATQPLRLPVQAVLRPQSDGHRDYRGYAGRISAGIVRVGEEIAVLPSGRRSRVVGIDQGQADGTVRELTEAFAPQSVTVRLADDIDISRGDLLASAEEPGHVTRTVSGMVCVLSERPVRPRDRVLLRAGTRTVRALVEEILDQLDIEAVEYIRAPQQLELNDIGRVRIRLADDLPIDDYHELRRTGAFLLIDEADGATMAAGMADAPDRYAGAEI